MAIYYYMFHLGFPLIDVAYSTGSGVWGFSFSFFFLCHRIHLRHEILDVLLMSGRVGAGPAVLSFFFFFFVSYDLAYYSPIIMITDGLATLAVGH